MQEGKEKRRLMRVTRRRKREKGKEKEKNS
jgi:hypothetical protein